MEPILIVDDEVEMRIAMSETLKHSGFPVELSHNAIDALSKIKKNAYAMVITDMTMPKRSGIELLKDIKAVNQSLPVLLVTAYGTIETAVEAMKYGAFDYILKPFKFDVFTFVVERALALAEVRKTATPAKATITEIKDPHPARGNRELVTADPAMQQLLGLAANIANSKATVLIQSESGTGKELLAHYIHDQSDRPDGPFVAVNCAALPETLLESELFGHRKGAFTGAIQEYKGRFEQAHMGTILLDEISEMAPALQAKLLRVLQEHEVDRIGGKEPIPVDIRVISTTNCDLFERVEGGQFREDLFFRLNVIPLLLPPLRDRKGDIPLLADHFIQKHAARNGRKPVSVASDAMELMCHYNWRGNVRELENVIERALLLCEGKEIRPQHLLMGQSALTMVIAPQAKAGKGGKAAAGNSGRGAPVMAGANGNSLGIKVGMSMREAEKKLIFETLRDLNGNRTQAAKVLSISIRTLRNKLNEYAAEGEDFDFDLVE